MAENFTPQTDIEIVRDLLSPYLDDEVTDEERALVNAALTDSPELRDELESLRQTVALVADLPRVPAPRPFTLTEADVQAATPKPKKSFGLPAWFGGFAAAAALLVCVLAVGGLFLTSQFGSGGMVGDVAMAPQQPAAEAVMEQPAAEQPAEEPAAEEPAPAEEEAPMEEEAAEEEVPAEEAPMEEAAEAETELLTEMEEKETAKVVVTKEAEEATNLAPPAVPATDTAGMLSDTDAAGAAAGEDKLEYQVLPTPTPAPSSTTTPTPSPGLAAPPAPREADETASEMEESVVIEGEAGAAEAPGASIPDEQDDLAQRTESQPTATAIALLTLQPPETPEATPPPPEPVQEDQPGTTPPYRTLTIIIVILVLVIILVIVIGLIVRWIRK